MALTMLATGVTACRFVRCFRRLRTLSRDHADSARILGVARDGDDPVADSPALQPLIVSAIVNRAPVATIPTIYVCSQYYVLT
jgi:hypothetical protein